MCRCSMCCNTVNGFWGERAVQRDPARCRSVLLVPLIQCLYLPVSLYVWKSTGVNTLRRCVGTFHISTRLRSRAACSRSTVLIQTHYRHTYTSKKINFERTISNKMSQIMLFAKKKTKANETSSTGAGSVLF